MTNSESDELETLRRSVSELERRMDAVGRIAVTLSTVTEVGQLVREALDTSLTLAGAEAGSILLYDPERKRLVFEYVVGEKADQLTGMEIGHHQGIAGYVLQTGKTSVSEDVSKENTHLRELGERIGYVTTNMITVPLRSPEAEPLGVMQVLNKRQGMFDEHDIKLIETIAAQIAVAITTFRLHEQARLAAIVRFIGNISHDVKNMITPAVTGAQTLQLIANDCFRKLDRSLQECAAPGDPSAEVMGALDELRNEYPEMIELILMGCSAVQQRMAEISAAIKGVVSEPQLEPTDVVALARRVGSVLDLQARKNGVGLIIEVERDIPAVDADGRQIYNAIYNLISNAIDACAEGDTVVLRLDCRLDGTFPHGNFVLVECADTGAGMPEHIRARLFTDEAVSTKPMGTGLGTRIIKNVIDAHGGTVEVETAMGVGTTMRCRIPATQCGRRSASGPK